MSDAASVTNLHEVPPEKLRLVITASTVGTVFEWYDFFVYAALASVMAPLFFTGLPDTQALIFALLTFSVGFVVRPLGALVFGKLGDSHGRKGAFLITISLMGLATFGIGLIPTAASAGLWAPVLLITCRVLQGFALGGEYGGAAIYVAEHAPQSKRGWATSAIQVSASIGLVGALAVILTSRSMLGEPAFKEWGWRIPFLVSALLLAVSLYIRVKLEESPSFQKLKEEGKVAKRAYHESFFVWKNAKVVLLALLGLMMAQGVVWYCAHFWVQVFMERFLKVDQKTVNLIMIAMVLCSAPLYIFFAWISDKIGRKPVLLFGMILMAAAYFPGFQMLSKALNPELTRASDQVAVVVLADPSDCSFMLDLTGGAQQFGSSCDIARTALSDAGVRYLTAAAPAIPTAKVRIGATEIDSISAVGKSTSEVREARKAFAAELAKTLKKNGFPTKADPAKMDFVLAFAVLLTFVVAATALYGPQAAALVELFPTQIRYTAMSLPYNIGTGWFGGLLPPVALAISSAAGDPYAGLWFPLVVTVISAGICLLFWPETKDRDIHA